MKILVVSLLRLGDIVMATGALAALRRQYPGCDLHILINRQFVQLSSLIPLVDQVKTFDREGLQKSLGDVESNLFEAYESVRLLVEELDEEKYDLVVNLTHNRLSGYLMSLLQAPSKLGLCLDSKGQADFGSYWFRLLNRQAEAESDEVFHYTDVFIFAIAGVEELFRPHLQETDAGRRQAQACVDMEDKPYITVQTLTSDAKKNWPLEKYFEALRLFAEAHPDVRIVLLASPNEAPTVDKLLRQLQAADIDAQMAVCGLDGAFSLLKRARLLLTGDTSIKHLASAAGTPIVELSLGSSDFHRTGSYSQNAVILQSKEVCAPCVHSKGCHRTAHFCADRVPADAVALVMREVWRRDWHQLPVIADEYKQDIDILRVEIQESGFWAAYSVLESFSERAIGRWIELAALKLYMFELQEGKDPIGTYGTESVRLLRLLEKIHPGVEGSDWRFLFSLLERHIESLTSRVQANRVNFQSMQKHFEDPKRLSQFVQQLRSLRERVRQVPACKSLVSVLNIVIEDEQAAPFVRLKRISEAMVELDARTQIELRVLRGMTQALDWKTHEGP